MALRIAICDDEEIHHKTAINLISAWANDRGEIVNTSTYETGEGFLFAWDDNPNFDVVFLDIRMEGLSGIDVAERIRRSDKNLLIVFVTNIMDYAIKGYEVQAFRYILKPLQKESVYRCLDQIIEIQKDMQQLSFIFKSDGEQRKVEMSNILYFEVEAHMITVHTINEGIPFRYKMRDLEREVPDCFVRIHRAYLVNLRFIFSIRVGEVTLNNDNKTTLPIGANRQEILNQAFMRYHRGKIG